MKWLLLLLALPLFTSAQRIALLSKDLKKPIIYTDSLTVAQLGQYFAVENNSFDSLYASLDYLSKMLNDRQRAKMKSFEFRSGSTIIKTSREPRAYGDRFNIVAESNIGNIKSVYRITTRKNNNAGNSRRVAQIMEYIRNNKTMFAVPAELHPKFYNVIVVTD